MEPPAKRAKVGRAPHDVLQLDRSNNKTNSNVDKNNGNKNNKTKNDEDGEDEIAMDPEDYAMKVDPEYRLDRSRAVADNKLKSAFELLFEKYSQDFGDTGDEINFYTDEIEVDNGHIASLPAKKRASKHRDEEDDDEQDSDEESVENGQTSSSTKPSGRRQGPGDPSRLASLLPPRFGPGGTVIVGGSTLAGPNGARAPMVINDSIDPTWAAPEIPDSAFTTPGGGPPPIPPPRNAYAVPQRTVFRKSLPASYGRGLGEDDDDKDDDLILDTPKLMTKANNEKEISPSSVASNRAEAASKPTRKLPRRTPSAPSAAVDAKQAAASNAAIPKHNKPRQTRRGGRQSEKATNRTSVPDSTSPEPPLLDVRSSAPPALNPSKAISPLRINPVLALIRSSSPAPASLPTPPEEHAGAQEADSALSQRASGSTNSKPKETFSRNTLDPSFVFSDDENFGLKKRKRPQRTEPRSTAVSTTEPQDETSNAKGDSTQDAPSTGEDEPAELESPVIEKRRPKRKRKSRDNLEVNKENTVEASSAPEVHRPREALSIIIMTASIPSSTPQSTPTATAAVTATVASTPPSKHTASERLRKQQQRRRQESSSVKTSRREVPDSQGNSSGIISLVSDGSADEAEIEEIEAASPFPFVPGSGSRLPLSARRSAQTTASDRKQITPSKDARGVGGSVTTSSRSRQTAAVALTATPSRQQHYAKVRLTPGAFHPSSPLARRQQALLTAAGGDAPSPGGSPVQTPGGTIRRCGKDGFRCEREFCFRCA